ncbi:hypothetical protein J2S06_000136 [Bacillus alveayuensis]|uniref:Uncharacterized protein n=2 Tax=Aeribacillus alveayuensis TaxID=279215 RepID=A0ABT9VJD6_9BACI|nr:hypothetical protein [Bacillus alveayuensis]
MQFFQYNERLGIMLPHLEKRLEEYEETIQEEILLKWEQIRGKIPDRIKSLEQWINQKQTQLEEEEDFETSCLLNSQIAELASIINDLWIWYRI